MALSAVGIQAVPNNWEWDCTNSPEACNNACYAVRCRGFSGLLTYDSDAKNEAKRRTNAGCKSSSPCAANSTLSYNSYGDSCHEYPFASSEQGGSGAFLRCVDQKENDCELEILHSIFSISRELFLYGPKEKILIYFLFI